MKYAVLGLAALMYGLVIAFPQRKAWFSLGAAAILAALGAAGLVPGVGPVLCDVAFGGAFYAFCRADDLGVRLVPEEFRRLIDLGMKVKRAVMAGLPIRTPAWRPCCRV